jgi:hypothetical protein
MEGEGEEAADEEAAVAGPFSSAWVEGRRQEKCNCWDCADSVLVSEIEEFIMGVSGLVEVAIEADQDSLDRAHTVAPEFEEVVEDAPDKPAEVVSGVVLDERGPGQGTGSDPESGALWAAVGQDKADYQSQKSSTRLR